MIRPTTTLLLAALAPIGLLAGNGKVPDHSKSPRAAVPVQDTWNPGDLYADEAAARKDLTALSAELKGLPRRAKGWTASAKAMADLLDWVSGLDRRLSRLHVYAGLMADTDLGNSQYQKLRGEIGTVGTEYGAALAFMGSDIQALGGTRFEAYLKQEKRLAPHAFGVRKTLREAAHILPAEQERIASLSGSFAGTGPKASGLLNNVDMPRPEVTLADGRTVKLDQAAYQILRASANVEDRRKVMDAYWTHARGFENTFAALMDGAIKSHWFNARIHKYDHCLDAALFGNAVDPSVYRNLISTVRANLSPMHRLLKLRQRMLKLPEFRYGDIYASAVSSVDRVYTYDEARAMILEAMKPLGKEYCTVLDSAFDNRWIDRYPNQGKRSGAYSNAAYGVHPYVLMNYDGRYHEVSTLAHELGHAMHSHLSNTAQPYPTADYPIFLAEIASTFNENMLMHHLLKQEGDDQLKLYLLDAYLEGLRGTLYRQTLFADFELAMHEAVEQGRTLTPDWLNAKYLELTRLYYGHDKGVVNVGDSIQSEWSGIPHFYYNFYVYQYATGVVASMALADAVQREGEPARKRYQAFLSAGGSDYPLNTLRKAGVDLASPEPVKAALASFDRFVGEMEAIVDRLEKKKESAR